MAWVYRKGEPLEQVENPVTIEAKKKAIEDAKSKGWVIRNGRPQKKSVEVDRPKQRGRPKKEQG